MPQKFELKRVNWKMLREVNILAVVIAVLGGTVAIALGQPWWTPFILWGVTAAYVNLNFVGGVAIDYHSYWQADKIREKNALVAELADAPGSSPGPERGGGSSPSRGTT